MPRKFLGFHVEDRLPVHEMRHTRVRLHDDRLRRHLRKPLDIGQHPVGTESTVESVRVDPDALEHRRHTLDVRTRQELPVFTQRDRDEHGKIAVLLRGQYRGLDLARITHRLDEDEIRLQSCRAI